MEHHRSAAELPARNVDELCSGLAARPNPKAKQDFLRLSEAKFLGSGCGRKAFLVCGCVVKLLINSKSSEVIQQKRDVYAMKMSGHKYIPQLIAYDAKDFQFLVMEYLEPVSKSEVPSAPKVMELCHHLRKGLHRYGCLDLELQRTEHWGRNASGQIKAVDFGC